MIPAQIHVVLFFLSLKSSAFKMFNMVYLFLREKLFVKSFLVLFSKTFILLHVLL